MKTALVILAGGNGTRLWPLSTNKVPKQFSAIVNEKTLLRNAYERVAQQYDNNDIFISTNTSFFDLVKEELPEIKKENYILEPKKMDRTAAFGLITLILKDRGYDTVILVACDEYIENLNEFLRVLKVAEEVNQNHPTKLLLVGMNPNYPATGYGYIEMGEPVARIGKDIIFSVQSFKEKPDQKTAEQFVSDWKYLWNSGWFMFNPDFLIEKYKELVPETYRHLEKCYKLDPKSEEFLLEFSQCEAITFDIAIVEKLKDVIVLPASVGWSDVGSWKAVKDILTDHNYSENAFQANVIALETEGSLVYSKDKKKLITLLGVKDIVVVDTGDVLLVTTIEKSESVKKVVAEVNEDLK